MSTPPSQDPAPGGVARDADGRRRLEDELRRSEEQFRGAFDAAAIGMALVAPDGRWLQVNRSLCDIVGYTEQELLGRTFQDITHPEDLDADLAHLREMLAGEIRSLHMEKRYFHKDGHIVWILLSVSLVHDAEGGPLYFISQVQDITARKRAEQERELLIRQLQEALATVKALRGLLPICAWCKNIRNDDGYWERLEAYFSEHLDVQFTHGMCPACTEKVRGKWSEPGG
jgi:PAS domain S-box-containing protein